MFGFHACVLTRLQGFLFPSLMVVPDTNTAINLVEQSRAQIGKLAGGDQRIGIQAIIMKEPGQVQTLEGKQH